jgi:hypothetical protein
MSFENPSRRSGDEGLRDVERAFNADPYNEPAQEAYFAELNRRGVINEEKGRTAQEQLYAALSARNTPEAATTRMNQILERFQMRGACVPVVSSPQAGAEAQVSENRWVAWRLVFREQTEEESKKSGNKEKIEIPGRIERVLYVKLNAITTAALIDAGHYDYEKPRIRTELTAIEAEHGEDNSLGLKEVPVAVFDRTVKTEEVKVWLDENDLRSSMKQLLTIGSQLADELRRGWLAALDETWLSRGFVPVLSEFDDVRNLNLYDRDRQWYHNDRFPAARKKN